MSKITTLSGKTIDVFNFKEEDIEAGDIIITLNNICRFGGRCRKFYSVADHAINLTQYFINKNEIELARIALLHDACEAYIGDIIWPIKTEIPKFEELENKISKVIFDKYNINTSRFKEFDKYDKNIVVNEMKVVGLYESNKHLISHLVEIHDCPILTTNNKNPYLTIQTMVLLWVNLLNEVPNMNI